MGHVQDRWWKDAGKDERGRPIRVRTPDFGKGQRYRVRYLDLNGAERSKSFPDRQKGAAEAFLHEIENDKNKGTYLDPTAGRMTFRQFAKSWLAAQTFNESTRDSVEVRLRIHVYPYFGDTELRDRTEHDSGVDPAAATARPRRDLPAHDLRQRLRRLHRRARRRTHPPQPLRGPLRQPSAWRVPQDHAVDVGTGSGRARGAGGAVSAGAVGRRRLRVAAG